MTSVREQRILTEEKMASVRKKIIMAPMMEP
jgi:hypothetical protein